MHVDDETLEAFRRDGYVCFTDVVDASWRTRLLASIDRGRSAPGPFHGVLSEPGEAHVESDLFRWFDDADLAAAMIESPLPHLACAVLHEPAVVLIEDQWFASDPGAATPSPWHQDDPYYNVDRPFLTLWLALDDVDADASLRVVAGSHLWGRTFAPVEFSSSSSTIGSNAALAAVPDIDADPSFDVRNLAAQAGDVVALDSRLLHATGRARVRRPFRRLSTRWAPSATRYVERGTQVAKFWTDLAHGLVHGDLLACDTFPLVRDPGLVFNRSVQ